MEQSLSPNSSSTLRNERKRKNVRVTLELHERQGEAFESKATELLYGGAASGGKSHLARVMCIQWALEIPGIQIYLFRRLYDDLVKNHIEGPTGFRAMLAPWLNSRNSKSPLIAGRLAEIVQGEIRFWNGSKIFLCHCQHQKDITKYYGVEMHALFIEEATQFSEFLIRFLRSRLRIPDKIKIPEKYKGQFPRAVYTSNPGGIGHAYIKRGFLDGFKPYEYHQAPKEDGGAIRQFIPARVDDNPSVDRAIVKANLSGLPNALRDALLNGNWNAIIGAYFPEASPEIHLIKPFQIPEHVMRFMALDYGACGDGDPFSLGWWAMSDGSFGYPRGALICYRRWHGRGLPKITVGQICDGIAQREREQVTFRVAGGDILEKRGTGPSAFELFQGSGYTFMRADMRRVSGWLQVRERLVGRNQTPMLYFFEECAEEFETLMNLQHDLNDPNDCAPGDDHFADMVRYACMARPWVREQAKADLPVEKKFKTPTINEMWERREEMLRARR